MACNQPKPEKVCETCGVSFCVRQSREANRFCSLPCYWKSRLGSEPPNKGVKTARVSHCLFCGAAKPYRATFKYCSRKCFGLATRGEGGYWRSRIQRKRLNIHKPKGLHRHHKIPLHMGGKDDESNISLLTPEQHAEAHWALWLEHGKREDFEAHRMLKGQISSAKPTQEMRKEWARRGGLACRGTPKGPRSDEWKRRQSLAQALAWKARKASDGAQELEGL